MTDVTAEAAARGLALMQESGSRIVTGVDRFGAAWVERAVARVADAWGQLDSESRTALDAAARDAGAKATARVVADLQSLFAADPAQQATTPLELVRTLRYEATEVLHDAGVPAIERDPFETRAFPDDMYAIVPHSLSDIDEGNDDLGPCLLAWGVGKAKVLRFRALRGESGDT